MIIRRAFLMLIPVAFIYACSKKGCTDSESLNYSEVAADDDGTCVKPRFLKVTSVELKLISNSDEDGVEWDAGGYPDCYIYVSASPKPGIAPPTTYTTEIVTDVTPNGTVVYNFNPAIVVDLDSTADFFWVHFTVYDDDGGASQGMAGAALQFNKPLQYAFETGFYKRFKMANNTSINGNYNMEQVSMTAVMEWE